MSLAIVARITALELRVQELEGQYLALQKRLDALIEMPKETKKTKKDARKAH